MKKIKDKLLYIYTTKNGKHFEYDTNKKTGVKIMKNEYDYVCFKHKLLTEVKSKISGFAGTIIGRYEDSHNIKNYFIEPKVVKGRKQENDWIYERDIIVTKKPANKKLKDSGYLAWKNSDK